MRLAPAQPPRACAKASPLPPPQNLINWDKVEERYVAAKK